MVITRIKEEALSSPKLNDIRGGFGGVVVIGGANIDLRGRPVGEVLERHTSNPGRINVGLGGVGRNIAHTLALLNVPVTLLSAVGDDGEGIRILEETGKAGVRMGQIIISGEHPTGIYLAILDEKGEMEVAVSDMKILEEISLEYLRSKAYLIKGSKIVVMDTNIPEESIEYVVDLCNKVKVPVLIEPVSMEKAKKLRKIVNGCEKCTVDYISFLVSAPKNDYFFFPSSLYTQCYILSTIFKHSPIRLIARHNLLQFPHHSLVIHLPCQHFQLSHIFLQLFPVNLFNLSYKYLFMPTISQHPASLLLSQ